MLQTFFAISLTPPNPLVTFALMPVRIKICGITNLHDAQLAVDAGADALGFIFYPKSSRFISIGEAAEILRNLPPLIARVGVFVDADIETISQTVREAGINHIQLHGDEPPRFAQELGLPIIKAFRVAGPETLKLLSQHKVSAYLLDSYTPGQHGGTGAKFNWDLVGSAQQFRTPVILAGGLTPENIAEAVRQTTPYAVDVSSGVEISPGKKDPVKVRAFIQAANAAVTL
jgi:phosphoribosylanthranilate isomerase